MEKNAPAAVAPSPAPAAATPAVEATEPVPQPQVEQNAPAAVAPSPPPAAATPPGQNAVTAPTEQAEPAGEAVGEPEPTGEADEHAEFGLPGSGIILVAKQPVEVLASPSSSAPALYGFPAGRPFRVIGREGGFAHIQDLRSSASGWIDEAALARPPRDPVGWLLLWERRPLLSRSLSQLAESLQIRLLGPKAKTTQKDRAVTAGSEVTAQPDRNRPGLFGRGGLFGGIFGNGN